MHVPNDLNDHFRSFVSNLMVSILKTIQLNQLVAIIDEYEIIHDLLDSIISGTP